MGQTEIEKESLVAFGLDVSDDNTDTDTDDAHAPRALIWCDASKGKGSTQNTAEILLRDVEANKDYIGGEVADITIGDPGEIAAQIDSFHDRIGVAGALDIRWGGPEEIDDILGEYSRTRYVLVDKLDALGSSHSEIKDRIDRIVTENRSLRVQSVNHIIEASSLSRQLKMIEALDVAGPEIERKTTQEDLRERLPPERLKHTGRPPFGFDLVDGELTPADNFDDIVATLRLVRQNGDNGISKRGAASKLGCSRRTIDRCLDRPELYGLEK